MAVGYGIGQREHLGCTDFLFAVNRSGGLDFGNAVIDHGNFYRLLVFRNADRIDFLIGKVSVGRLQFLNEPIAVGDIFKKENTVLAGFSGKDSTFSSELGFAAAEESELCACNHSLGFTVDFQALNRAVEDIILDGFAAVCFDLHKGGILSGIVEDYGIFLVGEDIVAVGCDFLYIQLCAYRNIRLECDIAVFIAICNFE